MGYTRRKIRGINISFLMAGFILSGWALFCAWYSWPRGIRGGSAAGFGIFAVGALFFAAFPAIWARFPEKHPVNHEIARYGDLAQVSSLLDTEMNGPVEVVGPFRFTATLLVYDSGHEFQMIPYDQIVSAKIEQPNPDDPAEIVVRTRTRRQYAWYRTWMQGLFNAEEVLAKIRAAAHLDDANSSESPMSSAV